MNSHLEDREARGKGRAHGLERGAAMTMLIRSSFHHTITATREEADEGEEEADIHLSTFYELSSGGPRSRVNPTA